MPVCKSTSRIKPIPFLLVSPEDGITASISSSACPALAKGWVRFGVAPNFRTCPLYREESAYMKQEFSAARGPASLAIFKKQNDLAMSNENIPKFYVIENKIVSNSERPDDEPARGEKMKDSLAMLLKTRGDKISENRSLAMLMIIKAIRQVSRDIDEKTSC